MYRSWSCYSSIFSSMVVLIPEIILVLNAVSITDFIPELAPSYPINLYARLDISTSLSPSLRILHIPRSYRISSKNSEIYRQFWLEFQYDPYIFCLNGWVKEFDNALTTIIIKIFNFRIAIGKTGRYVQCSNRQTDVGNN